MRTVVGVLRGGPSHEYDVSLKTGASVLENLDREKYEPRDIFISRGGEWHVHGAPQSPERALKGVDVAFNALHGEYGEDGKVQRLLEQLGMPYTGSDAFASGLAFNKQHTRDAVSKLGIQVAHGLVLEQGDPGLLAHQLFRTFPHPSIIKPIIGSGSQGVTVANSFHSLEHGLRHAFEFAPKIVVEEFIPGSDASVGVLQNFRNEPTYALIPEPGIFTHAQKDELTALAKQVHDALNLSHYSVSDFRVGKRGIYFLEVNTLPKLHHDGHFAKALGGIGASLGHFLDHVVGLALRRQGI